MMFQSRALPFVYYVQFMTFVTYGRSVKSRMTKHREARRLHYFLLRVKCRQTVGRGISHTIFSMLETLVFIHTGLYWSTCTCRFGYFQQF